MIWVWNHKRIFVIEHRFGLLECDAMFVGVIRRLFWVSLEGEFAHLEMSNTKYCSIVQVVFLK